ATASASAKWPSSGFIGRSVQARLLFWKKEFLSALRHGRGEDPGVSNGETVFLLLVAHKKKCLLPSSSPARLFHCHRIPRRGRWRRAIGGVPVAGFLQRVGHVLRHIGLVMLGQHLTGLENA